MVKYQIIHGTHRVYNYADKTWHEFGSSIAAFNFIREVKGIEQ